MTNKFEAKTQGQTKHTTQKQQRKKGPIPTKKVLASRKNGSLTKNTEGLGPDDMIPALHDLDAPGYSISSASESMDINDSVLGKRQGDKVYEQAQVENAEKALVPFMDIPRGGTTKRGKVDLESSATGASKEGTGWNMERKDVVEATSPGAACKLTGPSVVPRKEQ